MLDDFEIEKFQFQQIRWNFKNKIHKIYEINVAVLGNAYAEKFSFWQFSALAI